MYFCLSRRGAGIPDANETRDMIPRVTVNTGLGVDAGNLAIRLFVLKLNTPPPPPRENFVEVSNGDGVRTKEVAHSRVLAGAAEANHGVIVFVEDERAMSGQYRVPDVEGRYALAPDGHIGRHDFSLWSRVADATLAFALSVKGEVRARTSNDQAHPCGGILG